MKHNIILAGGTNLYTKNLETELEKLGHHIITDGETADMLLFCIDPAECKRDEHICL